MSLERPFSTIRKAVEESAEEKASKEFLDRPEPRHFEAAFNFYRTLRESDPEFFEAVVSLTAQRKEVRDTLGVELYSTFDRAWTSLINDHTNGYAAKVKAAFEQVQETKNLNQEELEEERIILTKRFLTEAANIIESDPQLLISFRGKEELLNKAVVFESSYFVNLLDASMKYNKKSTIQTRKDLVKTKNS